MVNLQMIVQGFLTCTGGIKRRTAGSIPASATRRPLTAASTANGNRYCSLSVLQLDEVVAPCSRPILQYDRRHMLSRHVTLKCIRSRLVACLRRENCAVRMSKPSVVSMLSTATKQYPVWVQHARSASVDRCIRCTSMQHLRQTCGSVKVRTRPPCKQLINPAVGAEVSYSRRYKDATNKTLTRISRPRYPLHDFVLFCALAVAWTVAALHFLRSFCGDDSLHGLYSTSPLLSHPRWHRQDFKLVESCAL